jgi:hypothetical protein
MPPGRRTERTNTLELEKEPDQGDPDATLRASYRAQSPTGVLKRRLRARSIRPVARPSIRKKLRNVLRIEQVVVGRRLWEEGRRAHDSSVTRHPGAVRPAATSPQPGPSRRNVLTEALVVAVGDQAGGEAEEGFVDVVASFPVDP